MAKKVPSLYRRWTHSAVECCNRQCVCEDCIMKDILKGRCKMKKAVINLVKYHGVPDEVKQPTVIKECCNAG